MFNPIDQGNPNATGEEALYYDGFRVDPHGNIRIPTLGELNVLGFTVEEVRKKIDALTVDSILEYVRRMPAEDFTVLTIGPKSLEVNS